LRSSSFRLSALFSRLSLALASLDEERRAFGGGRLVAGIFRPANPKSEYQNPKQTKPKN
jgi:hypothetical protein